jgi:serralysin
MAAPAATPSTAATMPTCSAGTRPARPALPAATADIIVDFDRPEGDELNLGGIDADITAAGDQAFTFIGTAAFSGTPGEIRYYHAGGYTYIEMQIGTAVDVEGVIRLNGIHKPEASWFVL